MHSKTKANVLTHDTEPCSCPSSPTKVMAEVEIEGIKVMIQTSVYNLIIVDKSGSMCDIQRETIAGVNETILTIQAAQRRTPDQRQFITLVAFCGCEQRYIYTNVAADEVKPITAADYQPCCMTPLYDAVGNACIGMEQRLREDKLATACVTIITDGYENASKEFNRTGIVSLIERLKNDGWMFAYIGADHDVESVAFSLHIDNVKKFQKDVEGTRRMFKEERCNRLSFYDRLHYSIAPCLDANGSAPNEEELAEVKRKASKNFFER